jgi:hypothetical protein
MQYNGFISTIIERSEQLLPVDARDDLQVTRMLLLLNTGFALVWDRIQYWEDHDDARLRRRNPWHAFKKARERKFAAAVTLQGEKIFENFRTCGDFSYFKIPNSPSVGTLSAHNIVRFLESAEEVLPETRSLDHIMRAMRNSFAHGGILPMSPDQAGDLRRSNALAPLRRDKIDRVYFVSKWTGDNVREHLGWIVMEFSLDALQFFWDDWKALLLLPGERAMLELDKVA